jgi:hypothetical protein
VGNRQQRQQTATDLYQHTIDLVRLGKLLDHLNSGPAEFDDYADTAGLLIKKTDTLLSARACAEDSMWDSRKWCRLRTFGLCFVVIPACGYAGGLWSVNEWVSLVFGFLLATGIDFALIRVEVDRQYRRLNRPPTVRSAVQRLPGATSSSQKERALFVAAGISLIVQALPLLTESHRLAAARKPVDLVNDVHQASQHLGAAATLVDLLAERIP